MKMKFKSKIPKEVDPIELADKIKKGLTRRFLEEAKILEQNRFK